MSIPPHSPPQPLVPSPAPQRSETAFNDYKLPLSPGQAMVEANRCLFCADAPCIAACPTAIDIPQFIRKISTGNLHGSARTIFESNILGMSCARVCPVEVLCVGACVYNHQDAPPIPIGQLQRFATDAAYAMGWRFFEAGPDSGKSVGLIGAGPASLAAAHELRRFGHRCTIYETRTTPGGLNSTGVAPYKLRADRALSEVEWVLGIGGIDLKLGTIVGKDVSLEELEQRHDAVFVGVGLGADTRLNIPGEDLLGVHGAVEWIERMKLGSVESLAGIRCLVIGGGNTAIDAVREALGLGAARVTMVYRGKSAGMSGYAHEWEAAKLTGATACWSALPTAFEGRNRVERVRCVKLDDQRRSIAGSEFTLDADLVLIAIGQAKLGTMLAALGGIAVDHGRVCIDAHGRTGRPRWYAGGDCTNGGKEVVNAAAEGKRAAAAIHADLLARAGRASNTGGTHA